MISPKVSEFRDMSYFKAFQGWIQIFSILTKFQGCKVQEFFSNIRAEKLLALGVGLSVFLYNDVKTAVVLQVLQSRFVNIVEFSKSDQPSILYKGVAQDHRHTRHTVTPPKKRTSANRPRKMVVSFDVFPFWGSFSASIFVFSGAKLVTYPRIPGSSAHSSHKTP